MTMQASNGVLRDLGVKKQISPPEGVIYYLGVLCFNHRTGYATQHNVPIVSIRGQARYESKSLETGNYEN